MTPTALLERVEALRRTEPARALDALESSFASALAGADASARGALGARAATCCARSRVRATRSRATPRRALVRPRRRRARSGRCAIGLVDALMYLGRYDEARRAAASGRRRLERAKDRAALARLLNNEAISGTGSTCPCARSRATARPCARSHARAIRAARA